MEVIIEFSNKVDSTSEGLVLENMNEPTDVKIAFRGSKMNNAGDWASNAKHRFRFRTSKFTI